MKVPNISSIPPTRSRQCRSQYQPTVDADPPALLLSYHQRNQTAKFARKGMQEEHRMSTHQANNNQSCFQQELAYPAITSNSYYVDLPLEALDDQGSLLDALIRFTFDTLNVQHLDLRIVAETH
jgi:hypothetical protein